MTLPLDPDYQTACELIDKDDLDFWRPVLQTICDRHDLTLQPWQKIGGWANGLFDFGNGIFIKIVPPNWGDQGVREVTALTLLKDHDLPVAIPDLLANGEINGWLYAVITKLPGTNLHDIWKTLDEDNQCEIVRDVGRFARYLNDLEVAEQPGLSENWPAFLQQQSQGAYDKRKSQGFTGPLLEDIKPFLANTDFQPKQPKRTLCHCDLHAGNLLAEQKDGRWVLTGVIDFGDALIGDDCFYEFGATMILMGLGNAKVNQAYLQGYGLALNPAQIEDLQRHMTALAIMRHSGDLNYVINEVPGCRELSDWHSVAKCFAAL